MKQYVRKACFGTGTVLSPGTIAEEPRVGYRMGAAPNPPGEEKSDVRTTTQQKAPTACPRSRLRTNPDEQPVSRCHADNFRGRARRTLGAFSGREEGTVPAPGSQLDARRTRMPRGARGAGEKRFAAHRRGIRAAEPGLLARISTSRYPKASRGLRGAGALRLRRVTRRNLRLAPRDLSN